MAYETAHRPPLAPLSADGGFLVRWVVNPVLASFDPFMRWVQRQVGQNGIAYVLLLPNLLVFGLFSFTPAILNIWISLTGGPSSLMAERPFVGFANFKALLACGSVLVPKSCPVAGFGFWTGMWNTLLFALIQVPTMTAVALATAIVLNRKIVGRGFWRGLFFYPVMLSPVVVAVIWDWILKRRGILNALIGEIVRIRNEWAQWPPTTWLGKALVFAVLALIARRLWHRRATPAGGAGFAVVAVLAVAALALFDARTLLAASPWRPINWLVDEATSWPFFWVVFVYTWAHLGFFTLILLAGLQAIPKDLYEAAEMDGTPHWRVFLRITLPLLMPTLLVVLVLSLIRAFQVFDEVYVLTGGGPGNATRMVIQHIYETAFTGDSKLYGIAAASSVLLALVILVLTLVQLALTRKQAGA